MVQIIPNVTLIEGAVTAIENYELQQGFQLITILINRVGEKEGSQFLGNDILNTEIKVLVSETLQKKLQLKTKVHVSGEIINADRSCGCSKQFLQQICFSLCIHLIDHISTTARECITKPIDCLITLC